MPRCQQMFSTSDHIRYIAASSISDWDVLMFLQDRLDLFSFNPVCPVESVKPGWCFVPGSTIPARGQSGNCQVEKYIEFAHFFLQNNIIYWRCSCRLLSEAL